MTSRFDDELETRLREALEDCGRWPSSESAVAAVLARIDGRSPAFLARESIDRSLRATCVIAAGVLALLVALSVGLPRPSPTAGLRESGADETRGVATNGVTIDEYFGEYSSEATILASLFAEEILQ